MDYLIQFQLYLYTFVILTILYITLRTRSKVRSFSNRLLEWLVIINAIGLLFDSLSWIFDGKVFAGSYFLENFSNYMVSFLGAVMTMLMMSYVDYYVFKDRKRIDRRLFHSLPVILNVLALIVNIFTPVYFSIDPVTNTYTPAATSWLEIMNIAGFYVYMAAIMIINRAKTSNKTVKVLMFIFFIPIVGMLIQVIVTELLFSWTFITLTLIIIYIYLETTTGETDYLTKLFSRQSYEKQFRYLTETGKEFSIIIIDLDGFKKINDVRGHLRGDEILIKFATMMYKAFSSERFICRLGGDEFVIIAENSEKISDNMDKLLKLIETSQDSDLNQLSFTYGIQKHEPEMGLDEIYHLADTKMYKNKK